MGLFRQIHEEWRWSCHAEVPGRCRALRHPGFWLMSVHRYGQWAASVRVPVAGMLARAFYLPCKVLVSALTGVDLKLGAVIGRRFNVHTCHGIVIADGVRIGNDCAINSGACVVHSANSRGEGTPVLGNHVRIGVGAKVLGGVTIGDHVIVGANAVVNRDVPPRSIAVGVPATVKPVPQAYLDEYYSPNYPARKVGLNDSPPEAEGAP